MVFRTCASATQTEPRDVGGEAPVKLGGKPRVRADLGEIVGAQPKAVLARQVTAARVARHFRGMIKGPVERFTLPNLHALNFLLHGALDGGGTISLKTDAQGKVLSTALLRMEIEVSR